MAPIGRERLSDIRDRALLLVGFAGAFRRCELVALNVDDIEEKAEGLRVNIRHSKTDQEGRGEVIAIPRGSIACPVVALMAWIASASITEGAVFRPLAKGGRPRNLWDHIRSKMPKKGRGDAGALNPLDLPPQLLTALESLYGHYVQTYIPQIGRSTESRFHFTKGEGLRFRSTNP